MGCCTAQYNFCITKGKDISIPVWFSGLPYVYKPIVGILNSAPVQLNVPGHGLPPSWRVAVISAKGLMNLNAKNEPPRPRDYRVVTVVDPNTLEFNNAVSLDWPIHTPNTGSIVYLTPIDLSAFVSARMQVKDIVGGVEQLLLTTANGGITLDNVAKVIRINIKGSDTKDWVVDSAVYDLELVGLGGGVTGLIGGGIVVNDEVTTFE